MIKRTTLMLMDLQELSFILNACMLALIAAPKEEYNHIDYVKSEIEEVMRQKEGN